jgi:hypothetical protein
VDGGGEADLNRDGNGASEVDGPGGEISGLSEVFSNEQSDVVLL